MKVKGIIVLLLLVLSFSNCYAEYQQKVVFTFEPLAKDQKLDYIVYGEKGLPRVTVLILRKEEGPLGYDKIKEVKSINYYPRILDNDTKFIYYTDAPETRGLADVYLVDGKAGKIYLLGRIYGNYDISEDGRYLCYEIDSKSKYIERLKNVRYKPGIVLEDLKTGKKQVYDFTNTFLKGDTWGSGTNIRYIQDRKVFSINFSIEDTVYSKGYINETGGEYHEYTDVIARARIHSDDYWLALRKEPDMKSKLVTYGEPVWFGARNGSVIEIIKRTTEKYKIGNNNYYWYKIRRFNMMEGWVYGAYLKILK